MTAWRSSTRRACAERSATNTPVSPRRRMLAQGPAHVRRHLAHTDTILAGVLIDECMLAEVQEACCDEDGTNCVEGHDVPVTCPVGCALVWPEFEELCGSHLASLGWETHTAPSSRSRLSIILCPVSSRSNCLTAWPSGARRCGG